MYTFHHAMNDVENLYYYFLQDKLNPHTNSDLHQDLQIPMVHYHDTS